MKREALIAYRGARSQTEMAQRYGVSQQTWSFWEHGIYTPPLGAIKNMALDSGQPMEILFPDAFKKQARKKPKK